VVNSSFRDTQASISEDGTALFFLSDRPGGLGNLDIYMTTRTVRDIE
jgi:Tol biopolymer transport system component